jgi:hypothetical protein
MNLIVIVALMGFPLSAAMQEDTGRLSAHLRTLRGVKDMSAAQYEKIQAEYIHLIDRRVTAGIDVAQINRELESAQLFVVRKPTTTDSFVTKASYLDQITKSAVRGADDLFVIDAAITTGDYCSEDSTAIVYRRNPVKMVGWINGQRLDGHGYYLTGIAAGDEINGSRVIASG